MKTVFYLYGQMSMIIVIVMGMTPFYGQPNTNDFQNLKGQANAIVSNTSIKDVFSYQSIIGDSLPPFSLELDSGDVIIPLLSPPKETLLPITPIDSKLAFAATAIQNKKIIKTVGKTKPVYTLPKDSIPLYKDKDIKNNLAFLEPPIDFSYKNNKSSLGLIRFYTENELYRQQVSDMLGRGKIYFPIIDDILQQYDLPKELRYLPAALSALRPTYEAKKALGVGLWQLPYRLAKTYGLEQDNVVDERKDIWLSTHVAAQILKDLYVKYNDWNVVIVAFTSGIGVMNKAIAHAYPRVRANERISYKQVEPFLPEEYELNLSLFIAVTYAMKYHEKHNIRVNKKEIFIDFSETDTITISFPMKLEDMMHVVNLPEATFYFLNPSIKKGTTQLSATPEKKYILTIPADKVKQLILYIKSKKGRMHLQDSFATLDPAQKEERLKYFLMKQKGHYPPFELDGAYAYIPVNPKNMGVSSLIHTVDDKEDLKDIAYIYNCDIRQIVDWNNLSPDHTTISVDQKLKIYVPTQFKKLYENINMKGGDLVNIMDKSMAHPIGQAKVNSSGKTSQKKNKVKQKVSNKKQLDQSKLSDHLYDIPSAPKTKEKSQKKKNKRKNKRTNSKQNIELYEEHGDEMIKHTTPVTKTEIVQSPISKKEISITQDGSLKKINIKEKVVLDGKPRNIKRKYIQKRKYSVQEEEDIEFIAKKFKIPIRFITYINNLPTSYLQEGQVLLIPTRDCPVPDDYWLDK